MMFRLPDLVVSVLLVVLTAGVIVPVSVGSSRASGKIKCAFNLRQIGLAFILYADGERSGSFPRTAFDPESPGPFVAGTPYDDADLPPRAGVSPYLTPTLPADLAAYVPQPSDVTTPQFLLLRTQDVTSQIFVCPSTDRTPWPGDPQQHTNFPGHSPLAGHTSYSTLNPYPTPAAAAAGWKYTNLLGSDDALAADMNPGTTPDANSRNHGGLGQNVLYADGHVSFETTPNAGIRRDNLYTARRDPLPKDADPLGPFPGESPMNPPADRFDAVLLPTAAMIGQPSDIHVPDPGRGAAVWPIVLFASLTVATVGVIVYRSTRRGGPGTPGAVG